MRISDWSSDVCSSDLQFAMIERHRFDRDAGAAKEGFGLAHPFGTELAFDDHRQLDIPGNADAAGIGIMDGLCEGRRFGFSIEDRDQRSEDLRVGKEGVDPCISRWSTHN